MEAAPDALKPLADFGNRKPETGMKVNISGQRLSACSIENAPR